MQNLYGIPNQYTRTALNEEKSTQYLIYTVKEKPWAFFMYRYTGKLNKQSIKTALGIKRRNGQKAILISFHHIKANGIRYFIDCETGVIRTIAEHNACMKL